LATDYHNALLAHAASAVLRNEKWRVSLLGDMSSAIDVMFDIDLQRFLNKIWPKREGIMIIIIFSSKEGEIKFFSRAVDTSTEKFGKNLRLALCTTIAKKTKTGVDFVSGDVEILLQWCQTVFESYQNQ
ncbi:MAG: ArsR family transcriptional regulator, partial [Nitrosotalea sp.]